MATKKKYYKAYETDKWNSAARKKARFKGAQKRIKNDKSYDESIIGKENKSKVGSFEVAAGGGTPKQDGGGRGSMNQDFYIAEDTEEAKEIREDNPGAVVRVAQGRDPETGEFISARDMGQKRQEEKRAKHPSLIDKDKKDVKFKKGDVIINKKGERDVILEDVSYEDFVEDVQKYLARKKGRKSGLEKELKGGSLRYVGGDKRKGTFLSGDKIKAEYFEYKKKKGKKGKVIRKDWIRKNPKTSEPPKQPENKPTQPTQEKGAFNSSDVKKNPKEYYEKNKDIINEMKTISPGLKDTDALKIIASGKFKNIQDFKEFVQKNKK